MTWEIKDHLGREILNTECPWLAPTENFKSWELCGHSEGPEKCSRPEECPQREKEGR